MVRRHNRLLIAFYVVSDALLAAWAFVLAYVVRFDFGLIAIRKGIPPFEEYLKVLPVLALLTPIVFHFQGVYRLRRGRSRIDDFFSVLVGSILVVVMCVLATLYFQAYWASANDRANGAYQVSQIV